MSGKHTQHLETLSRNALSYCVSLFLYMCVSLCRCFLSELGLMELLCVCWIESSSCLKVILSFLFFVPTVICKVDTHPTSRSLANHSSDCFLSNNTKYDPILFFPVLYSITRFILLVAISQGQGHKPNLSNVIQTVIGRTGRPKDKGVR